MNINATEELIRVLGEIDAKIKHLENSPNRAFVLVEYETLSLFHWFNLCFKQFWDEFDRHSVSQLLQYQRITKSYTELCERYVSLFGEQIAYLESVIDIKYKCVKELPPVIFSEDNCTDVIGYYTNCLKNHKDEEGKPLYNIILDSGTHSEIVNGKTIPIDLYMFQSDKLNDGHFKGLLGMYNCLNSILDLMFIVCSYPDEISSGYKPNQDEIISALENELRQYAKAEERDVERNLKKTSQDLKSSRNAPLTPDVWGRVMVMEDKLFDLSISGKLDENVDKCLENIFATSKQLTDNFSLLQKIKTTSLDEELFDIRLSVETHQLLSSLNADNLDLFYELVLRRNIIHREMFPDKLRAKYEEWLNQPENEQQPEEDEDTGLNNVRQSKLDEIIGILQRGNWKHPATAENIELLLNAIFGNDTSLLDESDTDKCEKMWSLVEGGGGDRMVIMPANLAGFFAEENFLSGAPKEISTALFGNGNQVNYINKGNSKRCSVAFREIIPFIKKYIDKIIRQV